MADRDDTRAERPRLLTEPQIEALVTQYRREMARYEKAAQHVADRIHREARAATLKHLVMFRAKHPDDLAGKLRKKAADPRYVPERLRAAMDTIVTDLAGCRVLLYESGDVPRVADIVRRVLPLRRDIAGYDERHEKPSGYRATHLLVGVEEAAETLSFQGAVCEVQVTTVAAHLFNELEHDVGYKDHGVAPTTDEREAMANLRDLTATLDRVAGAALRLRAGNVKAHTRTADTPDALRYALEQDAGRPLQGDFVRLYRLLTSLYDAVPVEALLGLRARLDAGDATAKALGLGEVDDVIRFTLAMRPADLRESRDIVSTWRGPRSPLKTAILRATSDEE